MTAIGQRPEEQQGVLPKEPTDFAGKHILLAEDNELNSEIATTLLEEQVPASPPLRTADWRWKPSRTLRRTPMTRF